MLSNGRARHPGPKPNCRPRQISVKFLNVGGWLTRGDLGTDSHGHFLSIAEHPSFLPGPEEFPPNFVRLAFFSVVGPACQDFAPGGRAGVGVVSFHGAPLLLHFCNAFSEFFRLERAITVILPLSW